MERTAEKQAILGVGVKNRMATGFFDGGEEGIRTLVRFNPQTDFESAPL